MITCRRRSDSPAPCGEVPCRGALLFAFDTPVLEILVRGTLTYLAIFVMLRVVGRRETGSVGITNLLTVVLLADAAQNAMAGEYTSIPDGVLLVGTIVFWSWFLDWAKYRWPAFARIVESPALPLVKDGRLLARNLRQEMITREEPRLFDAPSGRGYDRPPQGGRP